MKKNWINELEAQIFNGVDMDDDDAFYEALGVYENVSTLIQAMYEA